MRWIICWRLQGACSGFSITFRGRVHKGGEILLFCTARNAQLRLIGDFMAAWALSSYALPRSCRVLSDAGQSRDMTSRITRQPFYAVCRRSGVGSLGHETWFSQYYSALTCVTHENLLMQHKSASAYRSRTFLRFSDHKYVLFFTSPMCPMVAPTSLTREKGVKENGVYNGMLEAKGIAWRMGSLRQTVVRLRMQRKMAKFARWRVFPSRYSVRWIEIQPPKPLNDGVEMFVSFLGPF